MAEPEKSIDTKILQKLPELIEVEVDDPQYFRFGGIYAISIMTVSFTKRYQTQRGYKPKQVTFLFNIRINFILTLIFSSSKNWFMICTATPPYQ